ncbi:MAG TPA: LuxR C-terminal-related transcriptional regulator [Rhizomicrobium sp.]|nr:LuxR C-terminal-related transcriptional regulator [Rhizomicrobium sp.]
MPSKRGRPPHDDVLTPAEWRVVDAVRHGLTNRQIAARRGISADAVKYHVANAIGKLGFLRRKQLRHWAGVARHTALAIEEMKMTTEAPITAIGQVSRRVKDIDAARRWYADMLGLTHLYSFGDLAFFDCGGVRLYLQKDDNAGPGESILYFRVADIRQSHATLDERGVQFVGAPHMVHRHPDGTEEWMAFFNDNEGRPLALMAQVRN